MNIEEIRHCISAILMNTDEQNPMRCHITIGNDDAFGLSELEKPTITSAFQVPCEGYICFNIQGVKEPVDFDDIPENVLEYILDELRNQDPDETEKYIITF